jgi:hypothetical protein
MHSARVMTAAASICFPRGLLPPRRNCKIYWRFTNFLNKHPWWEGQVSPRFGLNIVLKCYCLGCSGTFQNWEAQGNGNDPSDPGRQRSTLLTDVRTRICRGPTKPGASAPCTCTGCLVNVHCGRSGVLVSCGAFCRNLFYGTTFLTFGVLFCSSAAPTAATNAPYTIDVD